MLKYTNVSVSKGFELLGKKTNIVPNDVINNIKQIELIKMIHHHLQVKEWVTKSANSI